MKESSLGKFIRWKKVGAGGKFSFLVPAGSGTIHLQDCVETESVHYVNLNLHE